MGLFYSLAALMSVFLVSNLLSTVFSVGVAFAIAVLVGLGVVLFGWQREPGVIVAPQLTSDREQHHVLVEDQDRKAFSDAIDLCQRTAETWPALEGLIDVPLAERQLAQALFDIAGVLERRQVVRDLQVELAEHADASELAPRRAKAATALAALDNELTRRLATLNAVAVAGEDLIRDERIGALGREADEVLARLSDAGAPALSDAGSELAERTEAVLQAYRELIDRTAN
jgi:hypothetical protein